MKRQNTKNNYYTKHKIETTHSFSRLKPIGDAK